MSKIVSKRELVKEGNTYGYMENGRFHALHSIDTFFREYDHSKHKRLEKAERYIPPIYKDGKVVQEGYFTRPKYREIFNEVKETTAPAFFDVEKLAHKERVHKDIANYFAYGRGASTIDGHKAIAALERRFPKIAGWKIETKLTVTDYNKYYTTIPIVAINKDEGKTELVDLHINAYDNIPRTQAKMSLSASMFEANHPRLPPVTSISKLVIGGNIHELEQVGDDVLSPLFYKSKGQFVRTKNERVISDAVSKLKLDLFSFKYSGRPREVTALSSKVDSNGKVTAVSAIKVRITNDGKVELIDKQQHHYFTRATGNEAKGWRRLETGYASKEWGKKEVARLVKYLGGSSIVATNDTLVSLFDDKDLRGRIVAQHGVFNPNSSFKRIFGRTARQYGFSNDILDKSASLLMRALGEAGSSGGAGVNARLAMFKTKDFTPPRVSKFNDIAKIPSGEMKNMADTFVKNVSVSDTINIARFLKSKSGLTPDQYGEVVNELLGNGMGDNAEYMQRVNNIIGILRQNAEAKKTFAPDRPEGNYALRVARQLDKYSLNSDQYRDFINALSDGLGDDNHFLSRVNTLTPLIQLKKKAAPYVTERGAGALALQYAKQTIQAGLRPESYSKFIDTHISGLSKNAPFMNKYNNFIGLLGGVQLPTNSRGEVISGDGVSVTSNEIAERRWALQQRKYERGGRIIGEVDPNAPNKVTINAPLDTPFARESYNNWYRSERHRIRGEAYDRRNAEMGASRLEFFIKESNKIMQENTKAVKAETKERGEFAKLTHAQQARYIGGAIQGVAGAALPINSWTLVNNAMGGAYSSINGAMNNAFGGSLFGSFLRPINNMFAATQNAIAYQNAQQSLNQSVAQGIGGAAQGAGTLIGSLIGGVPGGVIGGTVGSGINTIVQGALGGGWKAQIEAKNLTQFGQQQAQNFNLLGVYTQMFSPLLAGLKLFNRGLRLSVSFLNVFAKALQGMNLQVNRSGLTGLSVGAGQTAAYSVDRLMGMQAGTAMAGYENWSSEQMGLFTMGQINTNRLVASALLGQFSNVYSNGGDPVKQQAAFINALAKNNSQKRSAWASIVDPNLARQATMLQVMQRAGKVSSWEELTDPNTFKMYRAKVTDNQMANMYQARFTFGTFTDSIKTMFSKTVSGIWNKLTNTGIFSKFMSRADSIADMFNSGDISGGFGEIKKLGKELWEELNFDKLKNKFKDFLKGIWETLKPTLKTIFDSGIQMAIDFSNGWIKILVEGLRKVLNAADGLFTYLDDIYLDFSALGDKTGTKTLIHRKSDDAILEAKTKGMRKGFERTYKDMLVTEHGSEVFRWLSNRDYMKNADGSSRENEYLELNYLLGKAGIRNNFALGSKVFNEHDRELLVAANERLGAIYEPATYADNPEKEQKFLERVRNEVYNPLLGNLSPEAQKFLGIENTASIQVWGNTLLDGLEETTKKIGEEVGKGLGNLLTGASTKIELILKKDENGDLIAEVAADENGATVTKQNRRYLRNVTISETDTGRTIAKYTQAAMQ